VLTRELRRVISRTRLRSGSKFSCKLFARIAHLSGISKEETSMITNSSIILREFALSRLHIRRQGWNVKFIDRRVVNRERDVR